MIYLEKPEIRISLKRLFHRLQSLKLFLKQIYLQAVDSYLM